MKKQDKNKTELIGELAALRQRISELEMSQSGRYQTENVSSERYMLPWSEDQYYKAFFSNPDMITLSTLNNGCYLEINDSFTNKMGYQRHELIGHNVTELGIWQTPSDRSFMIDKVQKEGNINNFETRIRTREGQILDILVSADIIEVQGESCLLCVVKDITERKAMQNELAKLDRLNMVGEMAANIGHEIRNPMTSVRGFLQMFEMKYSEDKEYFDLMIQELDRANSIITEFLSLAKDKLVELKPRKLNSIVKNCMPLIEASAWMQNKIIKKELEDTPHSMLDDKEVRQLILNLAKNGLESMSSSGDLIIKTCYDGDKAVLSVQDEGCGIEPKDLDKLGTPFFTTKDKGKGLGLAVCYGITKRHNARIDIDTSSNGTIISVRFPVIKEESCLDACKDKANIG